MLKDKAEQNRLMTQLKASAYQFYQVLCCLTCPTAPAEVIDLYREFHRMSQIWRWMKRLKWAGYGFPKRKVAEVKKGELMNFCPACPQPSINIPDNWTDDHARQVDPPWLIFYSFNYLDGFIKGYLWSMEISRQIMFGQVGAPYCAEQFDSMNGHTVSNDSRSMNH